MSSPRSESEDIRTETRIDDWRKGGRTHLVSPEMAAASAIAGRFVDIRDW